MSVIVPVVLNWKGLSTSAELIAGTTPAPKLEYLTALNSRIQGACCGPYAQTGLACYLEFSSNKVLTQQMINIATKALRAHVARANTNGTAAPDDGSIYGQTSGSAAADEILTPSPFTAGSEQFPPDAGDVQIAPCAVVFQATPIAAMDRLLESPTATSLSAPVRERIEPKRGVGITVEPILVADLATL